MTEALSSNSMMVLSGSADRPLAEAMAAGMGVELGAVTTRRFADGEIFVRIDDNVRGRDLYIVQSTVPPADNIMELLLLLDAAQRASPRASRR
jgi:ribose-phosphate pyrophosphokinase